MLGYNPNPNPSPNPYSNSKQLYPNPNSNKPVPTRYVFVPFNEKGPEECIRHAQKRTRSMTDQDYPESINTPQLCINQPKTCTPKSSLLNKYTQAFCFPQHNSYFLNNLGSSPG